MIELKFHLPSFVKLALSQEEPEESLEQLLQQYDEACEEYKKFADEKEKAEAPWRRTRINEKGEEETYIDYDAWEKADSKECWSYSLGGFNGYEYIQMLECYIDAKICYMNQREKENNDSRTNFINDAIYKFRGGMAREFYFTNEDYPSIPYYYDPADDCLHADEVSVPFHYKEEEINNGVILEALETLEDALCEYFKNEKGITLYEYD